ncbi:MAG: hypothetical protein H6719_09910 [Sandaracinaceae bacterium]|nr:hypothetical protein [Sandaracinaceae bacterium]
MFEVPEHRLATAIFAVLVGCLATPHSAPSDELASASFEPADATYAGGYHEHDAHREADRPAVPAEENAPERSDDASSPERLSIGITPTEDRVRLLAAAHIGPSHAPRRDRLASSAPPVRLAARAPPLA